MEESFKYLKQEKFMELKVAFARIIFVSTHISLLPDKLSGVHLRID